MNLTADIDLSTVNNSWTKSTATYGELWRSIGGGSAYMPETGPGSPSYYPFSGTFDGHGYIISGLASETLFGVVLDTTLKNFKTSGTVKGTEIAGVVKLAGNSNLSNLESDVVLTHTTGTSTVGGIVERAFGNTNVTGCVFNGTITKINGQLAPLGGIVGEFGHTRYATTVTVTDSINYADFSGYSAVGGIVGASAYSVQSSITAVNIVIKNSINYGNINTTLDYAGERYSAGGILGASYYENASTPQSVTIENSANYGNVTGNVNAGGLVGTVWQGNQLSITNSYNQGDVTSTRVAGGIVGNISNAEGARITNTYNTGTIGSGTKSGGLAGLINGGAVGSVNNYYLDTAAPGAVNSASYTGVMALTAAQINDPSFAGMLGDGYVMGEDGYPILAWQSITPVDKNAIGVKYDDGAVAIKNANRLAVATIWFKADSGTPSFVGLNNFSVLDSAKEGSLYRITLGYLVAGGQGFTSANAGLLTISGATGIEITRAKFASYDDNGNAANTAYYLEKETGGGVVIPPGDDDPPVVPVNYDLNNDGAVDQLDLAIALKYFMTAQIADFNKDGVVDIEDFILLLNHMTF